MDDLTRRAFGVGIPSAVALAMSKPAVANPAEAARFDAISSEEWSWRQKEFPDDEDEKRDIAPYLPNVGAAAQAKRLEMWREVQSKLAAIDLTQLDDEARVNFAVYGNQIDGLVASQTFRDWEAPFNSDSSFWDDMTRLARRTFRTEADYRNYIAQLGQTPRYFAEQIDNMGAGLARLLTLRRPVNTEIPGRSLSASYGGRIATYLQHRGPR